MTDWKEVHGDHAPALLDMESSPNTVYERRNVRQETRDDMGETVTDWVYEERTYTMAEYAAHAISAQADAVDAVAAQALYTALMTDTIIDEEV